MDGTGLAEKCIWTQPKQDKLNNITQSSFGHARHADPPQINPTSNSHPQFTRPNNIPVIVRSGENNRGNSPTFFNKCYGCFESSHMLEECPKMAEMIRKGFLKMDPQTRKYYLPDGHRIY